MKTPSLSTFMPRLFAAAAFVALASTSVGCASTQPDTTDDATGESADELSRARFTLLRSGPTDASLKGLWSSMSKFEQSYTGVYRFNKASTEATDPEARVKRVKEVMHRYMCSFFDESIDIGRNTGSTANRVKVVLSDVGMDDNVSDQDGDVAAFTSALTNVYGHAALDVLSGGASGNNTAGQIMGVYDIKHNEVLFFGFTNCGSDD